MKVLKPINDEFRGDTEHLRRSIKALIEMDDLGSPVPHGIGGHARALLSASYHRLAPVRKIPVLCRVGHRWRPLPGDIGQGFSTEKCIRCGMHRTVTCALGHSAESEPFWP